MLRKGRSADPEPPETRGAEKSPGVRGPGTEARTAAWKTKGRKNGKNG